MQTFNSRIEKEDHSKYEPHRHGASAVSLVSRLPSLVSHLSSLISRLTSHVSQSLGSCSKQTRQTTQLAATPQAQKETWTTPRVEHPVSCIRAEICNYTGFSGHPTPKQGGKARQSLLDDSAATFTKYRRTVVLFSAVIGEEPNGREGLDGFPAPSALAHPPTLQAMLSLAPRTCSSPYGFRLSQADLQSSHSICGCGANWCVGFCSPLGLFCFEATADGGQARPSRKGLVQRGSWHAMAMGRRNLPTSEAGGPQILLVFHKIVHGRASSRLVGLNHLSSAALSPLPSLPSCVCLATQLSTAISVSIIGQSVQLTANLQGHNIITASSRDFFSLFGPALLPSQMILSLSPHTDSMQHIRIHHLARSEMPCFSFKL